jgi:hypothetical protein
MMPQIDVSKALADLDRGDAVDGCPGKTGRKFRRQYLGLDRTPPGLAPTFETRSIQRQGYGFNCRGRTFFTLLILPGSGSAPFGVALPADGIGSVTVSPEGLAASSGAGTASGIDG